MVPVAPAVKVGRVVRDAVAVLVLKAVPAAKAVRNVRTWNSDSARTIAAPLPAAIMGPAGGGLSCTFAPACDVRTEEKA